MYRLLLILIIYFTSVQITKAKEFQMTCISLDKSWQFSFQFNKKKKSIFWRNSLYLEKNKLIEVNEYLKIFDWRDDDVVITYSIMESDKMPSFFVFNLPRNLLNVAHLYTYQIEDYVYNCFSGDG